MSVPGVVHPLISKVVVVFDLCSSTAIFDDLLRTSNSRRWADLLIRLKEFLLARTVKEEFEIYKFVGDGYVLLFGPLYNPECILTLLRDLCRHYQKDYAKNIMPRLDKPPAVSGITFGIDRGALMRLRMLEQKEYVGRAINVACRLQGAVKDRGGNPSGKVLVAAHYHAAMRGAFAKWNPTRVKRTLRNIGEDLNCYKIDLLK